MFPLFCRGGFEDRKIAEKDKDKDEVDKPSESKPTDSKPAAEAKSSSESLANRGNDGDVYYAWAGNLGFSSCWYHSNH